jgi:hypothetical protein
MFLEERIAALERQVVSLEEEIRLLRTDLAYRARTTPPAPPAPPSAIYDKPALTTKEAARLLSRAPQTLRVWATYENGPIRPQRVVGRLLWATKDVMELIQHGDR